MIGAMIQKDTGPEYFRELCEKSYTLFSDELYDIVQAGEPEPIGDKFNFNVEDPEAPHFPIAIYWNRSIAALPHFHSGFSQTGISGQIEADFEQFIERIKTCV
jgi:hypothetical protein